MMTAREIAMLLVAGWLYGAVGLVLGARAALADAQMRLLSFVLIVLLWPIVLIVAMLRQRRES